MQEHTERLRKETVSVDQEQEAAAKKSRNERDVGSASLGNNRVTRTERRYAEN